MTRPTDEAAEHDRTVVLVHGNPETAAVWDRLVDELGDRTVVRLSPPGFGAPVPPGFGATYVEYRDWLVDELSALVAGGTRVDLVGHDWGGGHVLNVAMHRPDLLRSWCSDIFGVYAPGYRWHPLAQDYQTPGRGEELVSATTALTVADRAAGLGRLGMDPGVAAKVAAGYDDVMADCILRLYRSAAQPALENLGAGLGAASARPGLAIVATGDHVAGTREQHGWAAERAGARVAVLEGLGHWWMTTDPRSGAAALVEFWDSLRPA